MLEKFGIVANILPYFSYADNWKSLMCRLSRKTCQTFKKHKEAFKTLGNMHFGDREELLTLFKEFDVSFGHTLSKNTYLVLFVLDKEMLKQFKRYSAYTFPKVKQITVYIT